MSVSDKASELRKAVASLFEFIDEFDQAYPACRMDAEKRKVAKAVSAISSLLEAQEKAELRDSHEQAWEEALKQPLAKLGQAVVPDENMLNVVSIEIEVAMRKAFNYGQTYRQQADSQYISQQNKSDDTLKRFKEIVLNTQSTITSILAAQPKPKPEQQERPRGGKKITVMLKSGEQISCTTSVVFVRNKCGVIIYYDGEAIDESTAIGWWPCK